MKKRILVMLVAIVSIGYTAFAQQTAVETNNKPGWHKIAETTADLKADKDEVMVVGKDHFKSIKLKVTDVPVEIRDLTVYYENDTKQDVSVRHLLNAGDETREIDLDGKDRAIKKIVLMYKTVPNSDKDKSHIEIWGMK
jgi:hypothetical protein